jgi:hypothetical protein
MNKANLSINLLNAILQYLGQRPYVEVVGLIKAIEQEAQAQPESDNGDKEVDSGSDKKTRSASR